MREAKIYYQVADHCASYFTADFFLCPDMGIKGSVLIRKGQEIRQGRVVCRRGDGERSGVRCICAAELLGQEDRGRQNYLFLFGEV